MLINKLRTQEGLQVLLWIVIIEVTTYMKNLKFINTTESLTNALRSYPTQQKSGTYL